MNKNDQECQKIASMNLRTVLKETWCVRMQFLQKWDSLDKN